MTTSLTIDPPQVNNKQPQPAHLHAQLAAARKRQAALSNRHISEMSQRERHKLIDQAGAAITKISTAIAEWHRSAQ
jgi:hypothetical protein